MLFKIKKYLYGLIICSLFFGAFCQHVRAETILPDRIESDMTLTMLESPYIVPASVYVAPGVTLSIEPEVSLMAQDVSASIILDQSYLRTIEARDSRVGFNGVGIVASNHARISLKRAAFYKSVVGISVTDDSSITFDDGYFSGCISVCLEMRALSSESTVSSIGHVVFIGSECAVSIDSVSNLEFFHNSIYTNTEGIQVVNSPDISLAMNWWGAPSGPSWSTNNPDGLGDTVEGEMHIATWLVMDPNYAREPVIIVPGILGSTLERDTADGERLWLDLPRLVLSASDDFLLDLKLNTSGEADREKPLVARDIVREVTPTVGPTTHIFDRMIHALEGIGYQEGSSLFVFPYDWRLPVSDNALVLERFVQDVIRKTGHHAVGIVAHSMGGLVVQKYLHDVSNNQINQLIFIGTPHLGAPKVFKTLMYGDDMGMRAGPIGLLNASTIKELAQNFPSVYDLLPSQTFVGGFFSHPYVVQNGTALGYVETRDLLIADGRNPRLFAEAERLHQDTDTLVTNRHTYNIVGCGLTKTIGSFDLDTNTHKTRLLYTNGDDTVPLYSAVMPRVTNLYISNVSHTELPAAPDIVDRVRGIFSTYGDIHATDDVLESPAQCALGGTVVSKHSPVRLDVYDTEGKHTGPTEDGRIEYGISGVSYDQIGEETFAFLPEGRTYRVVNTPTGLGTYDFVIQKIAGDDSLVSEHVWNAVPITSLQSVSEVTVTDSFADSHLAIDSDGDGVYEHDYSVGDQVVTPPPVQQTHSAPVIISVVQKISVDEPKEPDSPQPPIEKIVQKSKRVSVARAVQIPQIAPVVAPKKESGLIALIRRLLARLFGK